MEVQYPLARNDLHGGRGLTLFVRIYLYIDQMCDGVEITGMRNDP